MAESSDDIMSIETLAEYLKISLSTLYKPAQAGRLVPSPVHAVPAAR
jgi:hypothetical protein